MTDKKLTIVVSVYNEEPVLEIFYAALQKQLTELAIQYEIIFVNDGSTDRTGELLLGLSSTSQHVKAIHLSRNFGHEAAMIAGIDFASGDAVICMDGDLQHPPSEIPRMLDAVAGGADIVTMRRLSRGDGGYLKRAASKMFYVFLNKISDIKLERNASDFFLISRRVAVILSRDYRERTRFLRGFIQQIGFTMTALEFVAPERAAGESKYSFTRLLLLSAAGTTAASQAPLRFAVLIAALFMLFSFVVAIYSIIMKFLGNPFSGYTTLVVLISFAFSMLFFVLGIVGEYLGNLFIESKQRPVYIVDELVNFDDRE